MDATFMTYLHGVPPLPDTAGAALFLHELERV
jgi:hypothetical protein